jgi:hypothetical protein
MEPQSSSTTRQWQHRKIWNATMNFADKSLYHQIHPAKLTTDIATEFVSLYILWRHDLVAGLVSHFLPPILASALVMAFADLEKQKRSRFGKYVGGMMTKPIQGARLLGDIIMVFGAWYHSLLAVVVGLLVVAAAWLSGVGQRPVHG